MEMQKVDRTMQNEDGETGVVSPFPYSAFCLLPSALMTHGN
jgi:hypothetical protein